MISTEIRKAGPYVGNGVTTSFPFSFKVFDETELLVIETSTDGVESTLVLSGDYSVVFNPNQDDAPGGYVMTTSAPAVGVKITITSDVEELQPMVLTNKGGFYPTVLNDSADRAIILIQQLAEKIARAVLSPISDPTVGLVLPPIDARAGLFLSFDVDGNLIATSGTGADSGLRTDLAKNDGTGGNLVSTKRPNGITEDINDALQRVPHFPEQYGAVGGGVVDDTVNLMKWINEAGDYALLRLKAGQTYLVDGNYDPSHIVYGGLRLRTGQILDLNGGTLKAKTTTEAGYSVVNCFGVDDWAIIGPGTIEGERNTHIGAVGEYGFGLSAWGCARFYVSPNIKFHNLWGDGIYIGYGYTGPDPGDGNPSDPCTDFLIMHPHVYDVRRNGISVVGARRFAIVRPYCHHVNGTAPFYGIDLEPNDSLYENQDGVILDPITHDVQGGVGFVFGNRRINIRGGRLLGVNFGLLFNSKSFDCHFSGGHAENTTGGAAGAAIRILGGVNIEDCSVRDCSLRGGGFFVIDSETNACGVAFENNDIHATNAGTAGFIRINATNTCTFTHNRCTIEAGSGVNGTQFLQVGDGITLGFNRYQNKGSNTPAAAIIGAATLLGTDNYVGALARPSSMGGFSGLVGRTLYARASAAIGGSGVAAGATRDLVITGVDCAAPNVILANAYGGGEGGADPLLIAHYVFARSGTGCTIRFKNNAAATQTINVDVTITEKR